ncbi:RES family NAD+ phosphorylase [Sphingomonas edaphi]|uniref:RES family NAD+ phosphorylase n=1 Tax=Sphingomonas edaphi TaxID=2315689 RepID=UPI001F383CD3|nr:RES family NAD+ phosphorylase [Sphingomonas edaphi]
MEIGDYEPPIAATDADVYRIVPSRFPPVSLFDRITEPQDLEAVLAVEAITNERLRQESGDVSLVPVDDRVVGPGSTPIMAAFTHLNPIGGRFTDSTYGAFYASLSIGTAIAETKHHREEFLSATEAGRPIDVDMRVYMARATGDLHDVRDGAPPIIYHPEDYSASQVLGRRLRSQGSDGIIFNSVRDAGGTCVAVFRPRLISNCRQERHLAYQWDGERIANIFEKREFVPAGL